MIGTRYPEENILILGIASFPLAELIETIFCIFSTPLAWLDAIYGGKARFSSCKRCSIYTAPATVEPALDCTATPAVKPVLDAYGSCGRQAAVRLYGSATVKPLSEIAPPTTVLSALIDYSRTTILANSLLHDILPFLMRNSGCLYFFRHGLVFPPARFKTCGRIYSASPFLLDQILINSTVSTSSSS